VVAKARAAEEGSIDDKVCADGAASVDLLILPLGRNYHYASLDQVNLRFGVLVPKC
jgi:hypothetical protein